MDGTTDLVDEGWLDSSRGAERGGGANDRDAPRRVLVVSVAFPHGDRECRGGRARRSGGRGGRDLVLVQKSRCSLRGMMTA
eukprot:30960-Pelagococcus_subviridis.AAC.5